MQNFKTVRKKNSFESPQSFLSFCGTKPLVRLVFIYIRPHFAFQRRRDRSWQMREKRSLNWSLWARSTRRPSGLRTSTSQMQSTSRDQEKVIHRFNIIIWSLIRFLWDSKNPFRVENWLGSEFEISANQNRAFYTLGLTNLVWFERWGGGGWSRS